MDTYLQRRQQVLQLLKELSTAQNRMKQFANRRSEREFNVGDLVYLKLKHTHQKALSQGQVTKLSPKFYSPFPVTAKFEKVAYQLQLPANCQIHPIFHVLAQEVNRHTRVDPSSPPFTQDTNPIKKPATIVDWRIIYKQGAPLTQVLVR